MTEELAIAWVDLSYRVRRFWFSPEITLLNTLKGGICFGTVTALMGSSGAGKTTLLKCINGKLKTGLSAESKLYLNSHELIRSCLIGQREKEHLIMGLSAKHNLIYASKLKNSEIGVSLDHTKIALDLLREFMISDIENSCVADCSGGEQKRLSIAIEMTHHIKPNLLCIDEPTTGLDSNAAENVMKCLSLLAKNHRIAILTSIHQPNNDILVLFDQMYVLAKGGVCVYFGPPSQLTLHLNACDIQCRHYEKPIEVLMKVALNDSTVRKLCEKTARDQTWLDWRCSDETQLFPKGIPFKSKGFKCVDCYHLMTRMIRNDYIHNWRLFLAEMSFFVLFPFIMTAMFNADIAVPNGCLDGEFLAQNCTDQLDRESLMDENCKYHYFMAAMSTFVILSMNAISFLKDALIYMNEHRNKWYSTGVFFTAKTIVDLLPCLVKGLLISSLALYFTAPNYDTERYIAYMKAVIYGVFEAQSLAYFLGIVFVKQELLALEVSVVAFVYSIFFSNTMLRITDLSPALQPLSYTSFLCHIYNQMILTIYGMNRCPKGQLSLMMNKFKVDDEMLETYPNYQLWYILLFRALTLIGLYLRTADFRVRDRKTTEKLTTIESNISVEPIAETNSATDEHKERERKVNFMPNIDEENTHSLYGKVSIAWTDLSLVVAGNWFSDEKTILDNINGYFEFGTLNALMGPSGAGKTTLLNVMNGRNVTLLSNETNIYLSRFTRIRTCFVSQDVCEHLLNGITAKEAVIYASRLKNTYDTDVDHCMNAETLMKELLIDDIEDTYCQHCSGGEQKRLVLAMELTAKRMPNVLCVDEPTSGLDSGSAETVIQCLKYLCRKHNISIITSIHQPSSDLLVLFDKIYVLSKGGRCIYSGEPANVETHLNSCGIAVKEFQIPIEVMIKKASKECTHKHVIRLAQNTGAAKEDIVGRCHTEAKHFTNGIQNRSKRFNVVDFRTLMSRTVVYTYRYFWKVLLIEFLFICIQALCLRCFLVPEMIAPTGCVSFDDDFNNQCNKTVVKVEEDRLLTQNIAFYLFVILCVIFVQIVCSTIKFLYELRIFLLEQRNGWYSTGTFYWCKTITDIIPTLLSLVFYAYLNDIYNEWQMFSFILFIIIISALVVQSMGHLIAIAFNDSPILATLIAIYCFVTQLLFSNFIIYTKEIHYSLQILSDFSTIKLCFEAIVVWIYGFDRCTEREFSAPLYFFDISDTDLHLGSALLCG